MKNIFGKRRSAKSGARAVEWTGAVFSPFPLHNGQCVKFFGKMTAKPR